MEDVVTDLVNSVHSSSNQTGKTGRNMTESEIDFEGLIKLAQKASEEAPKGMTEEVFMQTYKILLERSAVSRSQLSGAETPSENAPSASESDRFNSVEDVRSELETEFKNYSNLDTYYDKSIALLGSLRELGFEKVSPEQLETAYELLGEQMPSDIGNHLTSDMKGKKKYVRETDSGWELTTKGKNKVIELKNDD